MYKHFKKLPKIFLLEREESCHSAV